MPSDSRRRRSRPLKTCRKTLGSIVGMSLLVAIVGCGGDEASTEPQVVLEVQAPVSGLGTTIASLDYEIACDAEWNTLDTEGVFVPAMRRGGTMERIESAGSSPGAQLPISDVWRAAEEPLDGLCLLNLIGRDEQDQTICVSAETFEATNGQPTVVNTVMTCQDYPGLPGNASLAVELPGLVPGVDVETVEFTIDCDGGGTAFFESTPEFSEEVTINGNLEVVDDPDGSGMGVWNSFFDLPPGPCTMQLRARDPDGEVICTASDGFIIAPSQTTKVQIVLLCGI